MNIYKIIVFLTLIPFSVFSQYEYDDGIIITKTNDSIFCQVPLLDTYPKRIFIKYDKNGKKGVVKRSDIKYLATRYDVFENISYIKKKKEIERLMRIVQNGSIDLYLYIEMKIGETVEFYATTYTKPSTPLLEYAIRKNDQIIYIDPEHFKEIMKCIVEDEPELAYKIDNKELTYENRKEIVKLYNKNKTK